MKTRHLYLLYAQRNHFLFNLVSFIFVNCRIYIFEAVFGHMPLLIMALAHHFFLALINTQQALGSSYYWLLIKKKIHHVGQLLLYNCNHKLPMSLAPSKLVSSLIITFDHVQTIKNDKKGITQKINCTV